ncbi:multicopper oxidase [Zopfia rhizophila CBS 207.26]|uniref:Multicopper oxidase n=1 Tax=Zopfia rhizophila CBS 207.26 TaxID=1314779 RepID=A0A6A6ESZ8_9PEZI|nr:multicopper oxidase [Zopfia rhizophila CBS 207.26]
MFTFVFLAALLSSSVACKTVTYDFDVGWVSRAPDGFIRPVTGINGEWPIPTIEADKGDNIVVNVHNSLGNESTSLHFHGQFQVGSSAYDGPVGVTQCSIPPGGSFTYNFTAAPSGTFWYHSHDKGQYPDGLRGKMIIHDPPWEESLNVEEQIYLSMSDWYHTQMPYLINRYLSIHNRLGLLPPPNTFLINDARTGPTLYFKPGKRYLLRIVSMSALACNFFHINGHNMTIVGIDGVHVHPQEAESLVICAGQRYDVVVTAKTSPKTSFQYIAKMATGMLTNDIPSNRSLTVYGTIVYRDQSGRIFDSLYKYYNSSWLPTTVLNDMRLKPLDNQPLLPPPQQQINFRTNQTYYEGIGTRIAVGRQPWVEPKVPSLYTALSTGISASDPSTYGVGVDPWVLNAGDIVQIYMENPQPWGHPMHLHGHVFQVVARGFGSWDGNEATLPPIPMKRDDVIIPPNGYFVLRFEANNPGVWFFHCHIDLHLVAGMAATFIEAPDVLQRTQVIPASGTALCSADGQCSCGNCDCGQGPISEYDATTRCNTIFNSQLERYGALITAKQAKGCAKC